MSRTRRVAAVDCGTNSLRLLVADVDAEAGVLTDVDRRLEIVRLGQGVDRTGRFDPAALARTLDVAGEYAARCRAAQVQAIRFVATSATRDAADRDVFVAAVRDLFGTEPQVVSGDVEARLSFDGATRGLTGLADSTRVLVVDIGGGSTELVLGTLAGGVEAAASVDLGCVRLHERHGDPLTSAAEQDIGQALDAAAAAVDLGRAQALVGVAGTVTTVTAHTLRLERYDSARIHGARLDVAAVVAACADLVAMTRPRRAGLPYVHPGRVDVIGPGALIWQRVLERVGAAAGLTEVYTSEHDILDGIAWSLGGAG